MFLKTYFQFPYEVLFRSEQYGFMENACREYAFIVEFFMVTGAETMDLFQQIIGKTTSILIVSIVIKRLILEILTLKIYITFLEKC